jgi:hypothetical protein
MKERKTEKQKEIKSGGLSSIAFSQFALKLLSFVRGGEQPQGEEGLGLGGWPLPGGLAALVDFSSSGFLFSFGEPRPSFGAKGGRVAQQGVGWPCLLPASLSLVLTHGGQQCWSSCQQATLCTTALTSTAGPTTTTTAASTSTAWPNLFQGAPNDGHHIQPSKARVVQQGDKQEDQVQRLLSIILTAHLPTPVCGHSCCGLICLTFYPQEPAGLLASGPTAKQSTAAGHTTHSTTLTTTNAATTGYHHPYKPEEEGEEDEECRGFHATTLPAPSAATPTWRSAMIHQDTHVLRAQGTTCTAMYSNASLQQALQSSQRRHQWLWVSREREPLW